MPKHKQKHSKTLNISRKLNADNSNPIKICKVKTKAKTTTTQFRMEQILSRQDIFTEQEILQTDASIMRRLFKAGHN